MTIAIGQKFGVLIQFCFLIPLSEIFIFNFTIYTKSMKITILFLIMNCISCNVKKNRENENINVQNFTKKSQIMQSKVLFEQHCKICHGVTDIVVCYHLGNIDKRRTKEWFIQFTRNPEKIYAKGDTTAIRIVRRFNMQFMPNFDFLSKKQIAGIYDYLQYESIKIRPMLDSLDNIMKVY